MTETPEPRTIALGDPNAPEKIAGRSDSDRAAEIERKHPATDGAAAYDPAVRGSMGGQSGGADYVHPPMSGTDPTGATGGQSSPGYSGPGRLAGKRVDDGADINAVTRGEHGRKVP